tara:strand:+ start:335 stop:469 length:135 start_codon:yes stop_codon:yes gene_type:complete
MLTPALFAAKFYIIPISFPFLSPIKGFATLQTSFGWKIKFFMQD